MTQAVIVPSNEVLNVWSDVFHYLKRCDTEVSTAEDLSTLVLEGRRTLILVMENERLMGACIAKEVNGFAKKVVITTLGGDGANWNKAIEDFSRQIKAKGYTRLEVQGRRGWIKSLNNFDELHTTIGKDL